MSASTYARVKYLYMSTRVVQSDEMYMKVYMSLVENVNGAAMHFCCSNQLQEPRVCCTRTEQAALSCSGEHTAACRL
jgi:hypothetical protein